MLNNNNYRNNMENTLDSQFCSIIDSFNIKESDTVVLCDIDGTIFRNSLFIDIAEALLDELIQKGVLTEQHKEEYQEQMNLWKRREIAYDEYLHYIIENFVVNIKGLPESWLTDKSFEVVQKNHKIIYLWTKQLLDEYIRQGAKVILVSGSPYQAAEYFAKINNFTGTVATIYLKDEDNILTGERLRMFSSVSKMQVFNYIKEKYNPRKIVGIGDTKGDFELIKNSDEAYAINPSGELLSLLNEEYFLNPQTDKTIVLERKDMALCIPFHTIFNKQNWISFVRF